MATRNRTKATSATRRSPKKRTAKRAHAASKKTPAARANKTQLTGASVARFIDAIKDPGQREDAKALLHLMSRATNATPKMWGGSIVGFGTYQYKYDSGREGEWCVTGFSPRKGMTTVYILPGLHLHEARLKQLGKITTGKSCIYIKRVSDIDLPILEAMVRQATSDIRTFTPNVDMS
jgi:hypothetical protein